MKEKPRFKLNKSKYLNIWVGFQAKTKKKKKRRRRIMCYEAKCSGCGKVTWGGCGRHVASVYNRIEEAQRCMCKAWPGIDLSAPNKSQLSSDPKSTPESSTCNIL